MGRNPCCPKEGLNRGAWTVVEDKILTDYIKTHGEGRWRNLPQKAGLKRCGKSCRLRWLNYLRPDIKRGNISTDEEELIIRLHRLLGNRWSLIAGRLPGRTDNEIKNYWNTNLGKKALLDHHQQKNTTNKQQHHSRKLTKMTKDPSLSSRSASPSNTVATPTQVVRTKAIKCTRVILNPQPHKMIGHGRDAPHVNKEANFGPSNFKGNYDISNWGSEDTRKFKGLTPFAAGPSSTTANIDQVQYDDHSHIVAPNFVTNFNLAAADELCLAAILNTDHQVLDFLSDYNITNYGDDNHLSTSTTRSKGVQSSSNDLSDLLFSEEMLVQDWSDIQPNWLAD